MVVAVVLSILTSLISGKLCRTGITSKESRSTSRAYRWCLITIASTLSCTNNLWTSLPCRVKLRTSRAPKLFAIHVHLRISLICWYKIYLVSRAHIYYIQARVLNFRTTLIKYSDTSEKTKRYISAYRLY